MNKHLNITFLFLFFFVNAALHAQINPQKTLHELFVDVQKAQIFKDQKRFVDCEPKFAPDTILMAYRSQKKNANFKLKNFVAQHFDTLQNDTAAMIRHLHYLWADLTRLPEPQKPYSSLLALPNAYVVPGGRFTEIYYWDSYFTMLGLQQSGNIDLMENMVANFAFLIDTYGHIPNGNRSYYLSRSQPPFFALMVNLLAETKRDSTIYTQYIDVLEKEYNYWMSGNKVVEMGQNEWLNRYWDNENTPRPESYWHDANDFAKTKGDSVFFRDIRSAAESGWDFSTRWFADKRTMPTIQTTQIVPVDLNCLMYYLEITLAKAHLTNDKIARATYYRFKADKRKQLILNYFWDKNKGFFFDYNLKQHTLQTQFTLAGVFPLFFNLATEPQAEKAVHVLEKHFLKPGGWVTTLIVGAGQQWDYPNAWAPLQWVTYKGLLNYNYCTLAQAAAHRWLNLNIKVYFQTGKMMEKYDVVDLDKLGGGGEYDAQDGFGWTNGVFLKLWHELQK